MQVYQLVLVILKGGAPVIHWDKDFLRQTHQMPMKEKILDREILHVFIISTCTPWLDKINTEN